MRVPFCVLSQEIRHINFFFWGANIGCFGWGPKVYVEKVYVLFWFPPYILGTFLDIFQTFCRHSIYDFLGCPMACPLQAKGIPTKGIGKSYWKPWISGCSLQCLFSGFCGVQTYYLLGFDSFRSIDRYLFIERTYWKSWIFRLFSTGCFHLACCVPRIISTLYNSVVWFLLLYLLRKRNREREREGERERERDESQKERKKQRKKQRKIEIER